MTADDARLLLPHATGTCQVRFAADPAAALVELWAPDRWRGAAIIGDSTVVSRHVGPLLEVLSPLARPLVVCEFPPGEAHKTRATKAALEDRLLEHGLDRRCCVIGLGGGISLDLAGFVAATYLRGVAHINLPTSLLAQVDAAVGGKTGVNTPGGKNLVGAFHQPAAVVIAPGYLTTLPAQEWPNGLAELLKHAVIADAALFDWIEAHADALARPGRIDAFPLRRCVELKADIVRQDERETGLRAVLNFGHTVGHALERASDHVLSHGRAVALGMQVEARVAQALCGLPSAQLSRLLALTKRLGLPASLPALPFDALLPSLALDKKRDGGLRLALPRALGSMASPRPGVHTVEVALEQLRSAYEEHAQQPERMKR